MRRADSIKKPLAVAMFTGGRPETVVAPLRQDILTKAGIAFLRGWNQRRGQSAEYQLPNLISKSETNSKSQEIKKLNRTSTIRNCNIRG